MGRVQRARKFFSRPRFRASFLGQSPDFRIDGLTVEDDNRGIPNQYQQLRRMGFMVVRSSNLRHPSMRAMAARRTCQPSRQPVGPSEVLVLSLLRDNRPCPVFRGVPISGAAIALEAAIRARRRWSAVASV
jgi:hypothetical protein